MNRIFKGSVAGAAGIALLMGGFGTFALWQDTQVMPAESISSGTLEMSATAMAWSDTSTTTPVAIDDIETFHIVPGDEVTYTQTLTFTARGEHLEGELALALPKSIDTDADGQLDGAWAQYLDVSFELVSGTALFQSKVGGVYPFAQAADIDAKTANIEIAFRFDQDTPGQVAQNATAALSGAAVTLTQTR